MHVMISVVESEYIFVYIHGRWSSGRESAPSPRSPLGLSLPKQSSKTH